MSYKDTWRICRVCQRLYQPTGTRQLYCGSKECKATAGRRNDLKRAEREQARLTSLVNKKAGK